MLHLGAEEVSASLVEAMLSQPQNGEIVALGGAASEDHLLRLGGDNIGHVSARYLDGAAAPGTEDLAAAL